MPVIRSTAAVVHEAHNARFVSYVSAATSAGQLRFWRTELPQAGSGVPHRISREEVFAVIEGNVRLTLDDEEHVLGPGDVALAPAGTLLCLDNLGPAPAALWVSTHGGLRAQLADGTVMSPTWAA